MARGPSILPASRALACLAPSALAPSALALVGFALLPVFLGGCAGLGGAPQIRRTVGERSRVGIYVQPGSYEHFIRGELARDAGDLRAAAREYEAARAGPEDDPLIVARLADVYDRLGDEERAQAILREGDGLDADSETIHLARGAIAERHGRADEAEEAYARAAAAAPRSEAGPLALAGLMRARGEPDRADAVLERYLAGASGAGAARARLRLAVEHGDPEAAAEAVRALLEAAPARAEEVRAAVLTALDGDRPELAARLLAAMPELPEDRPLRLRALVSARRLDDAEALLRTWMPEGAPELLVVAEGYLAIGQPARARDLAEVALRGDGGPAAHLLLGRALRAMGRPTEAAVTLAAIAPGSDAWPRAPLALAAALRDAGRPAAAALALDRARARADDPALALALAEAREEAGDPRGALAALDGDTPPLVAARAGVLERQGDGEAAAQLYAGLDPDDPALDARARARAQVERAAAAGDAPRAIERLAAWVDRAPEDLSARVRLVELQRLAGQDDDAARDALRPLVILPGLQRRLAR